MFGYKGQHMNVLSWLWQLPQNILGLLVAIITRVKNLLTFIFNKGVQRREGVFRVGGENQYFHVNPVINDIGQIVDYRIEFKIGKFEPTSVTSNIKGEVIVMAVDVGDAKRK